MTLESASAPEDRSIHTAAITATRRALTRADGRSPLWIEVAVALWLFWLYDIINDLAPLRRALAFHNATAIFNFEHSLGISPELALDHWVGSHAVLTTLTSYYYVLAHFAVTFGLLVYLWWCRRSLYRSLRTQLVIINLIGMFIFWQFPVAPPRMLVSHGFRDIIGLSHIIGFQSGALASAADQYAAMPSLHIAWAIWCAQVIWRTQSRCHLRVLAVIYPFLTAFVVLSTGNHFLVDALAGAFVAGLAIGIERALARWLQPHWHRHHGHLFEGKSAHIIGH
jgi:hypothetical protein